MTTEEQRDRLLAALEFVVARFDEAVDHVPEYMAIADTARALIAECRAAMGTEDAEREALEDDLHGRTL